MGRNIDVSKFEGAQEEAFKNVGAGTSSFSKLLNTDRVVEGEKTLEFFQGIPKLDVSEFANGRTMVTIPMNFWLYKITDEKHPMAKKEYWYGRAYDVHTIDKKRYICAKSFGEPCPICDRVWEVKDALGATTKDGWAKLPDVAQKVFTNISSKRRAVYIVEVRGKLYWWDTPRNEFEKLLDATLRNEPDATLGNTWFLDDNGVTLNVKFTYKTVNKDIKYWQPSDISFVPRESISDAVAGAIASVKWDNILNRSASADMKKAIMECDALNALADQGGLVEEEVQVSEKIPVSDRRSVAKAEEEVPDNIPFDAEEESDEEEVENFNTRCRIVR